VPPQTLALTPLLVAIHTRKLDGFCRAAVGLLQYARSSTSTGNDAARIVHVLQTRVIPEVDGIQGREGREVETIGLATRVVLELFGISAGGDETSAWAASLVYHWYVEDVQAWKTSFESTLQRFVSLSPPYPIFFGSIDSV
jgi:hypothetical protein